MTIKDFTNNVDLGLDQAITFLFSLFTHDPFHDMYFSHGTGKLRALQFWWARNGKMPDSPSAGLFHPKKGGKALRGGNPEDEYDEEDAGAADILLALKMGVVTIPTMADKIFLNIDGRAIASMCATDVQYCIYIDIEQALQWKQTPTMAMFTPGWVVIDEEILSPFDLQELEPQSVPGLEQGLLAFRVINGDNVGLQMNITRNEQGVTSITVVPPPLETGEQPETVRLNQLSGFAECINPDLTYQIKQVFDNENKIYQANNEDDEPFEEYVIDNRLRQAQNNPGTPMEDSAYTGKQLYDAFNSTFYYLCVHTGLLNIPVILTGITGQQDKLAYLYNELLKTPIILELKAPAIGIDYNATVIEIQGLVENIAKGTNIQPRANNQQPLVLLGDQPYPIINFLANINTNFYPSITTADEAFLITLSKMCIIYELQFTDKNYCQRKRGEIVGFRNNAASTIAGFNESLFDQFLLVLADDVLFKQLEIDIIDEEDDDSDSDYDPDEEEEGDYGDDEYEYEYNDEGQTNLAEYISGLGGQPADEGQWQLWANEVLKAMRSVPPQTLYNYLLQINEEDRATLFKLLSPEEQQIQNQLDARNTQQQALQQQMLTDEDLMKVEQVFNQAYQNNQPQEALNVLRTLLPIQIVQLRKLYRTRGALNILDQAVNELPEDVKESVTNLTDPRELSGGAVNPVNTLYESTEIGAVTVTLANAFLGLRAEADPRKVRGSERTNPDIEKGMNDNFAPLMKGALGTYIMNHVQRSNYTSVVQLKSLKEQGTSYLNLFPPPPNPSILPGYRDNDKTKEQIRKIKRNLLRFDSEGFTTLTQALAGFAAGQGQVTPNQLLTQTILNEEYIAYPLTYSAKQPQIYKLLQDIFDNISTMMSFLAMVINLTFNTNTAPANPMFYDYYFSKDGDFNGYLAIILEYFRMADPLFQFITQLMGKKLPFSALGRLNNGYVLGTVAAIMTHCLENAPNTGKAKMLFTEEKRMIENLLTKGASGKYDKLLNNQAPPNDTKLVTSIINQTDFYTRQGNALLIDKWPAAAGPGVKNSLFNDMKAMGWGGVVNTMDPADIDTYGRFFVNNAVSMSVDRLDVSQKHYCPTASIIDAMTTICPNLTKSLESGVEWGIMDFMVQCPLPKGPQAYSENNLFTYRLRVEPSANGFKNDKNVPTKVNISAYFQMNVFQQDPRLPARKVMLINVRKGDIPPADGWPAGFHDGFEVNLNTNDSGPLSARASVENLQYFVDALPFVVGLTDTYENLITTLHQATGSEIICTFTGQNFTTPTGATGTVNAKFREFFQDGPYTVDMLRRGIIEHSFRKSLGDYLQEMTTIVANGGYIKGNFRGQVIEGPQYSRDARIRPPNNGRLGLHNDRPAAARSILLTLFARGDINPNTMSGLVVTDKENRLNYVIAGRGVTDQDYQRSQTGQGGGKKQKKTRRKKKQQKKKKKTKRNVKKKAVRKSKKHANKVKKRKRRTIKKR